MTCASLAAWFGIMVVGAAIAAVRVLTVPSRAAAFGFTHGVPATPGIGDGDILFIVTALYGLSILAGYRTRISS